MVPATQLLFRQALLLGETLRIDVHGSRQAVLPHRGRGGAQEAAGERRERTWVAGLGEELGAMPAPEAEQRSRSEQLGVSPAPLELRPKLGEQRRGLVRA